MKILVTGGSGFFGSHLVREMLIQGHEVRILDKVCSSQYPELCHIGDVRNSADCEKAVKGIDLVYHLAAEHRDDVTPISLYYDVNVHGSAILAAACTAHGVTRLVFTSSVAIYGLNKGEPTEETRPEPFNDYGKSKLEAEKVLRQWAHDHPAVSLGIVRPTVVFGEGNRGNVYNLVKQISSGKFVMVGEGSNRKSMAYVGNVVSFLCFIGTMPRPGVTVCNYADKPDFTMNDLVGTVRNFMGKPFKPSFRIPYSVGMAGGACFDLIASLCRKKLPVSAVRVKKFCADTTVGVHRLNQLGFHPPYTLKEGMARFLSHEFRESRT